MQLHQILRIISIESPIVLLDSACVRIAKVRSKIEIDLDLYEYRVLGIGSANTMFVENMYQPCIYIIIEK